MVARGKADEISIYLHCFTSKSLQHHIPALLLFREFSFSPPALIGSRNDCNTFCLNRCVDVRGALVLRGNPKRASRVTEVLIKTKRQDVKTVRKRPHSAPTPLPNPTIPRPSSLPTPSSSAWRGRRLSRDGEGTALIVTAFHLGSARQNPQQTLICTVFFKKFSLPSLRTLALGSRQKYISSRSLFFFCHGSPQIADREPGSVMERGTMHSGELRPTVQHRSQVTI